MIRIWLNHWFSTAYNIINLIKADEKDFYIIGSNKNINSVIKCVCDEWYQEPVEVSGKEYVDYCVEFCKEHKIDIFMPRREMVEISKHIHLFEELGTKVMVDNYDTMSMLNNKSEAYRLFTEKGIGIVPEYKIVTDVNEFKWAYSELCERYEQICFKFVNDEGGRSFRLIDNNRRGYASLLYSSSTRITYKDALEALAEKKSFPPIMLMPYLPDNEVSVDCLKTEQGIIMLSREKNATRIERLFYDEQILDICRKFYKEIGLEQPCNIQFKYLNGVPYFLEVNTRMSGGVQMSCLAAGVNIPNIAVNKLLGINKPWKIEREEQFVSHIEMPLLIK